ncbi:putative WD repeat-containing protein [Nymphon striatum]|nr:putative WD repeat-containing protein [Nymphon striatum]
MAELMESIKTLIKRMVDKKIQSDVGLHSYLTLNRTVQESIVEAQTHLYKFKTLYRSRDKWIPQHANLVDRIGLLLQDSATKTRNTPILIYGSSCSGKSSLLVSVRKLISKKTIAVISLSNVLKSKFCIQIFKESEVWLGRPIIRIVRRIGATPQSSYPAELLRSLCHHITLAFGFEALPKRFCYDFGRLHIWFQDLLKLVEATGTELLIVLDDLDRLKVANNNKEGSVFGWIPVNLPSNVHIVLSISETETKLIENAKARGSSSYCLIKIEPLNQTGDQAPLLYIPAIVKNLTFSDDNCRQRVVDSLQRLQNLRRDIPLWLYSVVAAKCKNLNLTMVWNSDKPEVTVVKCILSSTEDKCGKFFLERISLYLIYATYGLTEKELADLLGHEESSKFEIDGTIRDRVLATWPAIRSELDCLLTEEYVDGRIYIKWANEMITDIVKEKYSGCDWTRKKQIHVQLSKYFLISFMHSKDFLVRRGFFDGSAAKQLDYSIHKFRSHQLSTGVLEPVEVAKGLIQTAKLMVAQLKQRSEDSQSGYNVPDTRCIEELWTQLLLASDFTSLKKFVICSFHFLSSALSAMSVSYVRSLLELVKFKVINWELEVVLNIMKLSVDILSFDPYQLASEIINWLSPLCDGSSDIQALVTQAKEWSQQYSLPMIMPFSSWLNFALPQQAANPLPMEHSVERICVTRDNQKVICTINDKDILMYHIASKQKENIFTDPIQLSAGHKNRVTCIHISYNGKMLVSGSEDTTVLVWSVNSAKIRYVISEHIAGVLCVKTTHNDNLVISGCSFGTIIISQLRSGELVHKIDHHKGGVTCVEVNQNDDILVTDIGKYFQIPLTTNNDSDAMSLARAAQIIRTDMFQELFSFKVSFSSKCQEKFLSLVLIAMEVTSMCCGWDNSRAVIGCADGKLYVYDIHSSQLVQILSAHFGAVTDIQIVAKDHFMVTAGGDKIVIWNFASNAVSWMENKSKQTVQSINHNEAITCMALSRDGLLTATGGKDNKVKIWQVTSSALTIEYGDHTGPITCITFAQNGSSVVSGSEDKTVIVWGITNQVMTSTYKVRIHEGKITNVALTEDSHRVVSSDALGFIRVWVAETGVELTMCHRPGKLLTVQAGVVFIIGGKSENTLRMWPLRDPEVEKSVNHVEAISCYTTTHDMKYIITGSHDMSLKVWEAASCKLTQAGHEGAVSCVTVAPLVPSLVASGSHDCNVIVWDMLTGSETHTVIGHSAVVNSVKLTIDGAYVVSEAKFKESKDLSVSQSNLCSVAVIYHSHGSSDNMVMLSCTRTGQRISIFDLHSPVASVHPTLDAKYLIIQLEYSKYIPILTLLNSSIPRKAVDEYYSIPLAENLFNNGVTKGGPASDRRRRLGREQSVDWERKSWLNATRCLSSLSLDDFTQLSPCASQETLLRDPIHVAPFAHPKEKRYGVSPNSRISANAFRRPRSKMLLRQNTVNITLPESLEKIIQKESVIQELSKTKSASSEAVNLSNRELQNIGKPNKEPEMCSIS